MKGDRWARGEMPHHGAGPGELNSARCCARGSPQTSANRVCIYMLMIGYARRLHMICANLFYHD